MLAASYPDFVAHVFPPFRPCSAGNSIRGRRSQWQLIAVAVERNRAKAAKTRVLFSLFAALSLAHHSAAHAQSAQWEMLRSPDGKAVARVQGSGILTGVAVTCQRRIPILAFSLGPSVSGIRIHLKVSGSDREANFDVVREGATPVWMTLVGDVRTLDAFFAAEGAEVTIDGMLAGSIPAAGAKEAFQIALAACYGEPPPQLASTR
jgi:hypothetical protein